MMKTEQPIVIQLGALVPWIVTEYADCVVASCDLLGLTALADTMDELPDIIEETLDDLFHSLIQENSLDEFLRRRGWKHHYKVNFTKPLESDTEIRVPWEIIQQQGANRHVPC
jgi:hypothetical protein